jgi:hypothetical protein
MDEIGRKHHKGNYQDSKKLHRHYCISCSGPKRHRHSILSKQSKRTTFCSKKQTKKFAKIQYLTKNE